MNGARGVDRGALGAVLGPEDKLAEDSLRPRTLDEMIGQDRLRENLSVFVTASRRRGEPLDHTLFYGPPGLGKTSLARIVAHEMGAAFHATSGPAIERPGDLAALLSNIEPGAVLFIDEIHRLSAAVEEILYPSMEDFKLDLLIGDGPSARSIRLDLPRFTLIGATTRAGLLSAPLRDRFGWSARLEYYPVADLERIVARSGRLLALDVAAQAAGEIAARSRGTPRIANRLLRRVRDFTEVADFDVAAGARDVADASIEHAATCRVDLAAARFALGRLEVDEAGFDALDRALLGALIDKYDGGPVGLETLAAAVGEDKGTLEDVVEPFLIHQGFLDRTPRGRIATPRARDHWRARSGLGLATPA